MTQFEDPFTTMSSRRKTAAVVHQKNKNKKRTTTTTTTTTNNTAVHNFHNPFDLTAHNPQLFFNSLVEYPTQLGAVIIATSNTVTNGHCLLDAVRQGMESHTGPLTDNKTYLDLRTDVSYWALDNPGYPLGVNFTQEFFLQSHLRNPQLSILQYNEWWESVLSTDSYAESPLIMGLAVFIDYNICVWRRATTTTST